MYHFYYFHSQLCELFSEVLLDQDWRDLHLDLCNCDEELKFNPKRLFFKVLELL